MVAQPCRSAGVEGQFLRLEDIESLLDATARRYTGLGHWAAFDPPLTTLMPSLHHIHKHYVSFQDPNSS